MAYKWFSPLPRKIKLPYTLYINRDHKHYIAKQTNKRHKFVMQRKISGRWIGGEVGRTHSIAKRLKHYMYNNQTRGCIVLGLYHRHGIKGPRHSKKQDTTIIISSRTNPRNSLSWTLNHSNHQMAVQICQSCTERFQESLSQWLQQPLQTVCQPLRTWNPPQIAPTCLKLQTVFAQRHRPVWHLSTAQHNGVTGVELLKVFP